MHGGAGLQAGRSSAGGATSAGLQAGRSAAGGATLVFVALDAGGAGLQARRSTAGGATSARKREVHHVTMLC